MNDLQDTLFGTGTELTALQMSVRGFLIFFFALVMIRISGRRSFGLGMPFDNIVTILLGAVLSRAVVGASPFGPTVITCLCIVILHRVLGWLTVHNKTLSKWIEGEKIILFKQGKIIEKNMNKAIVCQEDVAQGVRDTIQSESTDGIDKIYLERNGKISVIRK